MGIFPDQAYLDCLEQILPAYGDSRYLVLLNGQARSAPMIINNSTDVLTGNTTHSFVTGCRVRIAPVVNGGAFAEIAGLSVLPSQDFWVRVITGQSISLHTSLDGALWEYDAVDFSSAGSSTMNVVEAPLGGNDHFPALVPREIGGYSRFSDFSLTAKKVGDRWIYNPIYMRLPNPASTSLTASWIAMIKDGTENVGDEQGVIEMIRALPPLVIPAGQTFLMTLGAGVE
jgi:hypothetical protein